MNGQAEARIVDQGFETYSGPLTSVGFRFWAVAAGQLKLAWKEHWLRRVLWMAAMPLVVLSVLVVVQGRMGASFGHLLQPWKIFWGMQVFFAVLVTYFVGRRAVGEDLHSGAMVVYLSRPIGLMGYAFGKWLAMAVFILGVTVVPGLLLALACWLSTGTSVLRFLADIVGLLVGGGLLALSFGCLMLAVSSLTRRGRTAGILWIGLVFVSAGLADGLAHGTGLTWLRAVGLGEGNARLTLWLLGEESSALDAAAGLAGQLLWSAIALLVLKLRLRRFE